MHPLKGRKRHSQQYSNSIVVVAVPRSNRLKLSLAGTAAVALASMALAVSPASAARVTEATTSSIGVVEASPNAQQFNLKTQGASTVLVAGRPGPIFLPFRIRFCKNLPEFITILFCNF